MDEGAEVVQLIPQEAVQQGTVEEVRDVSAPQSQEQINKMVKVISPERVSRITYVHLSFLFQCGDGLPVSHGGGTSEKVRPPWKVHTWCSEESGGRQKVLEDGVLFVVVLFVMLN